MSKAIINEKRILRAVAVAKKLGCHRTSVWRMVQSGKLPKPIHDGAIRGWLESEIDAVIDAAAAERDGRAA